jgi:hypothetical protein
LQLGYGAMGERDQDGQNTRGLECQIPHVRTQDARARGFRCFES